MISASLHETYRRDRILCWIGGFFGCVIIGLFIASFFLDGIIRARTQVAMNQKLTGYHVALDHAHLQLLGGVLTLNGLKVIQQEHPHPPIANIEMLRFHVQLEPLLSRQIVADVLLHRPKIHIDEEQLATEKNSKVPLRKKGWQDALEAAYPFKINRLTIDEGDVVYIQDAVSPPLRLTGLDFTADNIRNIHASGNAYPSRFHTTMTIFNTGRATVDGHANFLEEPFPGARAQYRISNVPLSAFDPEIRQINVTVHGGRMDSDGLLEYSPKVSRVDVNNATITDVDVGYTHSLATQKQEAQRVNETGQQIERQNNRSAVYITVRELEVKHSNLSYADQAGDRHYELFINDTDLTLQNLSNHQQQGPANLYVHGKFMGSGDTTVSGTFLASRGGPACNLKLSLVKTDLPSLNDLLRSLGSFDVAAGKLSVYSQVAVKDGKVDGYIKPMFADLEVYDYKRDKNRPIVLQAKELIIGGASHLLRSHRTSELASDFDIHGTLKSPEIDSWQALGQVLRNAFIEAIIPGFDRTVASNGSSETGRESRQAP